jgi:hypothetical protein
LFGTTVGVVVVVVVVVGGLVVVVLVVGLVDVLRYEVPVRPAEPSASKRAPKVSFFMLTDSIIDFDLFFNLKDF